MDPGAFWAESCLTPRLSHERDLAVRLPRVQVQGPFLQARPPAPFQRLLSPPLRKRVTKTLMP